MSVVALDIGTSNIKVLLASWAGRIVDERSVGTPIESHADGTHGFPLDELLARSKTLIAATTRDHPDEAVDTLVITCLGSAMVPVDAAERPLGPALSPADTRPWRGGGLAEKLNLPLDELRHLTGSDPLVASFLLHWLWWRDRHPDEMARLHRFRSLRGFVAEDLSGADAEDRSWASRTMLLDLQTNDWSDAILDDARLSRDALPTIHPSTAMWSLRPERIAQLGLAADARLVLGGIDNCCAFLGSTEPDAPSLVNIVGTYEHIAGISSLDVARPVAATGEGIIHTYLLPDTTITMTRIPIGLLLARAAETDSRSLEDLLTEISLYPTGARIALDAAAVDAAMTAGADTVQLVQRLLESSIDLLGVFADAWQSPERLTDHLIAVGGGAKHGSALQLKANMLGRAISTLSSEQGASLGALRLAAIAVHGDSPDEACLRFANPVATTWRPMPAS
jgi:xylulokinase